MKEHEKFYSMIAEKERPEEFQALGNLYYIFQVVQPALLKKIYPDVRELNAQ